MYGKKLLSIPPHNSALIEARKHTRRPDRVATIILLSIFPSLVILSLPRKPHQDSNMQVSRFFLLTRSLAVSLSLHMHTYLSPLFLIKSDQKSNDRAQTNQ